MINGTQLDELVTLDDYIDYFESIKDDDNKVDYLAQNIQSCIDKVDGDSQQKQDFVNKVTRLQRDIRNQRAQTVDDPYCFDYDFSDYSLEFPSWETLNEDNEPYPIFLRDFILPNFHPLPMGHIQYPIVAAAMLVNSVALPKYGKNVPKECPLSPVYIQGQAGSGKSQLANLFMRHYGDDNSVTIKGDTTGGGLVEAFDDACRSNKEDDNNPRLRSALAVLDNFYIGNIDRWGDFSVSLLATEQKDAHSRKAGEKGGKYWCWIHKVFTSVETLEATKTKNSELLRRVLPIYTRKYTPTLSSGKYDWSSISEKYLQLWNRDDTKKKFLPLLSEVMQLADDDTAIHPNYLARSQIILAVGVYAGLWESIDEAAEHMAAYWDWINSKESIKGDPLLKLCEEYLQNRTKDVNDYIESGYSEYEAEKHNSIYIPEMMHTIESRSGGIYTYNDKNYKAVVEIMRNKGFGINTAEDGLRFVSEI